MIKNLIKNYGKVKVFGIIVGAIVALSLVITPFCIKRIKVDAGEEVVLVKKPMFFGHGGVVKETVKTGSVWVARTTEGYGVPVTPIQYEEKFDDMATKNTTPVDFSAFIKFKIVNPSLLVDKFGNNWYQINIQRKFQNLIRNYCRLYTMDELVTNSTVTQNIEAEIQNEIDKFVKTVGVPVLVADVVIGKVSPNEEVMNEINATAAQQQREKTEVQRAKAEVARKDAELKRADADNAYRQEMQLNPDQFIKLEAVKQYSEACAKNPNCTIVVTQQGSSVLVGSK